MNEIPEKCRSILHLPRHISKTHPPMSHEKRAAQFSPYAALVGHKEQINSTENRYDHILDDTRQQQIITESDQNVIFEDF